ncbi:U3 small nucleolar RNA-associated protein 6 [Phlyctema vagabunda]|uniref:U3 small nucleolar RNA-associated protein 6 n=1 Tax=Phlyctema vagabunda TaxID=108571 RepID=A0ABR4PSM8_9HELO
MSAASDKARFYMEKAAPHFREFEEKKIFTKDEINTMVKKKSNFEHKVLGRGTQPIDFARYAAWEINLEQLRQKRCKRLRIKGSSAAPGQALIFNIFERGTRKHPGDLALWMTYLEYARQAKATNKFKTILTSAIRLQPTKSVLWLYAARWALENEADMTGARSYMTRGTRFCTRSKELWIEYAKMEMIYVAKIAMRRKILGLDVDESAKAAQAIEPTAEDQEFSASADVIAIPDFKTYALNTSVVDEVAVDADPQMDPMKTPALTGGIPLAIYDDARKQDFFCATAAEDFFNMFILFSQLSFLPRILQHVLDTMRELYPTDASTCNCYIRQPLVGIDAMSPSFPMALNTSLARLRESMDLTRDPAELAKKTRAWVEPILAVEDLDPGIRTVLEHALRKLN